MAMKEGSPQLVSGKPFSHKNVEMYERNTPTCMGKTKRFADAKKASWEHPHLCGESLLY